MRCTRKGCMQFCWNFPVRWVACGGGISSFVAIRTKEKRVMTKKIYGNYEKNLLKLLMYQKICSIIYRLDVR